LLSERGGQGSADTAASASSDAEVRAFMV